MYRRRCSSHHVPDEVGQPVEQRLHSADELHVFGLADALLDEEDHKASWDEGHGKDDADGDQNIHRGRHPGVEEEEEEEDENDSLITTVLLRCVDLLRSLCFCVALDLLVSGVYSQRHLGQLLLGEVQRVVEGSDAVHAGVLPLRQVGPQDAVVHHIDEGADAVPALVVEPHLEDQM